MYLIESNLGSVQGMSPNNHPQKYRTPTTLAFARETELPECGRNGWQNITNRLKPLDPGTMPFPASARVSNLWSEVPHPIVRH